MNILILILLLISTPCFATQVTSPYVYQINDTVTNVKLNSNQNAITNIVNGGLDNTNANTTSGYRFFQTVAVLPAAGNQGAVYFLTSDNTLNFDNGSSFIKSIATNSTPARGDIIYYNGTAWTDLVAGTSGQFLQTQGAGANPQWTSALALTGGTVTGPVTFASTVTVSLGLNLMGAKVSKSATTVYQAATDGIVTDLYAFTTNSSAKSISDLTDSANPPTTVIGGADDTNSSNGRGTITFPVKKNDYWEVTDNGNCNHTIFFTPTGT